MAIFARGAAGKPKVELTPWVVTKNTTGVTHQDAACSTTTEDYVIIKYQVPSGTAIVIGGTKPKQRMYYHDFNDSINGALTGVVKFYKVSPDQASRRKLIATYDMAFANADVADKDKQPDLGLEMASVIKEHWWLFVTIQVATAGTAAAAGYYVATGSSFRIDLNRMTTVED